MIAQTALHAKKQILWVIDSGCSKHMTGEKRKFIELKKCKEGSVSIGDNTTIKICGKGILSLDGNKKKKDVLYFKRLKHDLLSVSQMCDNGHKVTFNFEGCQIRKNGKTIAQGVRIDSNLYNLCELKGNNCLISHVDESCLWNKRLDHVNLYNLVKTSSRGLVRNLPKITKPTNTTCKACQEGKQTRVKFPTKDYSTTNHCKQFTIICVIP